jgi:AraC-like DNA-binding protein
MNRVDEDISAAAMPATTALKNLRYRELSDPAAAQAALATSLAVEQMRALCTHGGFVQQIAQLVINAVRLVAWVSSPVEIRLAPADRPYLIAVSGAPSLCSTASDGIRSIAAGGGLLLPPVTPAAFTVHGSAVVFALCPRELHLAQQTLTASIETAEQPPVELAVAHLRSQSPLLLNASQSLQLQALLQHLDLCLAHSAGLPAQLGLDGLLHRLVVAWLLPELMAKPGLDRRRRIRDRADGTSFDDLLDYIRANLHRPLRLSDLEARSHYSSRALQYAFRERLGCTSRQWIRELRLQRAMDQLISQGQHCSIKAIALACGYRHMSQFSSDFKTRFGLSPSAVWLPPANPGQSLTA